MSKKKAKGRKRRNRSGPAATMASKVNVSVAFAETDLAAAARLIKPAVLYADRITVFSPAASLLQAVQDLGGITDSRRRALVLFSVIEQVPSLWDQLEVDTATFSGLKMLIGMDDVARKRLFQRTGTGPQKIAALDDALDQLDGVTGKIDEAVTEAIDRVGGQELVTALDAKVVAVSNLFTTTSDSVVAETVNSAAGNPDPAATALLFESFMDQLRKIVTDPKAFPLLDGSSAGLVRALEAEGGVVPDGRAMLHGAEIGVAAGSMGFLPSFPDLPMDEVLDLRSVLKEPLSRFRVEIARLAKEIESRPVDAEFDVDVADTWRLRIEPSLQELREILADNGLLRTAASIASGRYEALLSEAGGAMAVGHAITWDLFGTVAASVAAPMGHVAVKTAQSYFATRTAAKRHAFYFLHRLDHESTRRMA